MSSTTPLIAVEDLTKTYDLGETKVHALQGVSLTVMSGAAGEIRPGLTWIHTPGHAPGHIAVIAECAAERVVIDWDPMPAVTDVAKAVVPGAPASARKRRIPRLAIRRRTGRLSCLQAVQAARLACRDGPQQAGGPGLRAVRR